MQTTSDEFEYVQSWIGTAETQAAFDARFTRSSAQTSDRTEALNLAIEESIRAQLSVMLLNQPSSVSLPGGLSISYGANIQALQLALKSFTANRGSSRGRISHMVRTFDR